MNIYRTHVCNELGVAHVGNEVALSGWVYRKRDHGGLLFVDLRDFYGITQLIFNESENPELFNRMATIGLESVITVRGIVAERSEDNVNASIETGRVEVKVSTLTVVSEAAPLPLHVPTSFSYPEDIRLQHRFLDLRCDKVKTAYCSDQWSYQS